MIGELMAEVRRKTAGVDWEEIAPRCGWRACARRTRWQGVVRRLQGIRFEGAWFCGPECFQSHVEQRVDAILSARRVPARARDHRVPLGLLLMSRGVLERAQLDAALQYQQATGLRLGDCLRRVNAVTEAQITAAVAVQWGCAVYPEGGPTESVRLVPKLLQEEYRCAPLRWVEAGRVLFIGFDESVDYSLLFAIEHMLDCHTEACLVTEKELERRLLANSSARNSEVEFATFLSPRQTALTVASYVEQVQAERVRFFECTERMWFRLERKAMSFDLLFRRSA